MPSDATSDNYYTPGTRLAQNNWSSGTLIDLRTEDERGGHSIANHVGKTEAYLLNVVHQQALSTTRRGELAEGLREGSFPSLESANKLVSSTLSQNPDKVAAVAAAFRRGNKPMRYSIDRRELKHMLPMSGRELIFEKQTESGL